MSNYFYGEITVTNDITGQPMGNDDLLFTIDGSSITLSMPEDLIVSTSDLDEYGMPISYVIFKKFDREILWDFGDGTKIRGLKASHSYKQPGTYSITCTCFDADGNPYRNNFPKTAQAVKVVDILNTTLAYTQEYLKKVDAGLLSNIHAGETTEIAEVSATLDKVITEDVPVKCYTAKSNSENIFNLKVGTSFQHLLPYNTFLNSKNEPTLSIVPDYKNVYVLLTSVDDKIKLNLYILDPDYVDNTPVEPLLLDSSIPYESETFIIKDLSEISSENHYFIGKTGKASVFYRDDLPAELIETTFVLDQDYFPDANILLSKNIINLVSIGTSLEIKNNNLTGDEVLFYSTNGLTTAKGTEDSPIYDLSLSNNKFSFDRAKYLNIETPFVLRVISNKDNPYFIKDVKIKNISLDNKSVIPENSAGVTIYSGVSSILGNLYTDVGSCFCSLVPSLETNDIKSSFTLCLTLEDSNNNTRDYRLTVDNLTYIDFDSFTNPESKYYLDPKQNYIDYSAEDAWEIYKTHPVFEEVPVLDDYMISIFKNKDFLQSVINKGWNFVDDVANINTCSLKNLISILDSIDIKIDLYNNENFGKPDVINNLLKIFSISHSRLIGTTIKEEDEFETQDMLAGKNRGAEIPLDEKIYIPMVDGQYIWPKIICYDRYDQKYTVLNTALLATVPESPIKSDDNGDYFQIIDYFKGWGWGLLLGDLEYYNYTILAPKKNERLIFNLLAKSPELVKAKEQISKFYQFYQYIDTDNTRVENSYLKPETISENIKDYNVWYKDDGSMDRLLYKTLVENLNLS